MAKTKNRRSYFRIYDEVNLFYKKIDEQLVTEQHPISGNILNSYTLSTNLDVGSQDSALLLRRLEKNLPDVADYLRLIDAKMDLLAQDVTMPGFQFKENDTRNVNISASGIAFSCEEALKAGEYLVIKIMLVSSMTVLLTYGKIVYCKNSPPSDIQCPYVVGVDFINMKDENRALLIKHVAKRRLQQLWVWGFILAAVITVVAIPDVVFGLLFELFHFLFEHVLEFIHIVFEFTESTLDHLIEHLFHTGVHETQVIVFYILVSFGLYVLYRLWRVLPPFFLRCKNNQIAYWSRKKASLLYYWQEQSLFNKIKLVVIGAAAITGYVFFGM